VSGANDQTVQLWDAATGKALQTLKGYTSSAASVAFTPNTSSNLLPILQVLNHSVVEGNTNIISLPPNYRETCLATHNQTLVLGHLSGGLSLFCFEKEAKLVIQN
jgi:hypothetical protein